MLTRYEDAPKERQLTVARIAALAVMPSLTVDDLAEITKVEREYHEKKSATEPILARTAVLLRDGRVVDAGYLQDNPEHVEAMLAACGRQFSAVLAAVYYVNEGKVTGEGIIYDQEPGEGVCREALAEWVKIAGELFEVEREEGRRRAG